MASVIASAILSLVGAGMSYSASVNSANAQTKIAAINAGAARQTAGEQGRLSQMDAKISHQLTLADKRAKEQTAAKLEAQAEQNSRINAENIRRSRDEANRVIAANRVSMASQGILDTSDSPLDILKASAIERERMVSEMAYENEVSRRGLYEQAHDVKRGASLQVIEANRYKAEAGASMARARAEQAQANINLAGERAAARGQKASALGSLMSSMGSIAGQGYTGYQYRTPRSA